MAARNVPGAADKPARRVVPGAPPPASKPGKKGKGAIKDNDAVKVPDATSAALIEKAPENPKRVANGLKVTSQDLAEQAEAQAAVAAVNAVQSSTNSSSTTPSTPAQKIISNRIADLSSKSKNATITVAIDELKSLLNKVQQAESAAPSASTQTDSKAQLVLLLQFLHLFNLFHPNPAGPSTFAPSRNMPPALEMSTGQQVAALAKVYDRLANGPLEGGGGDALEILANIEKGSSDEILPDVSFGTVRSMILKLTAPPGEPEPESKASSGLDGPPKDFVSVDCKASPSAAPVSFIQASEILDQSKGEPEGGQPSTLPPTGTSSKGKQGGAGIVVGDKAATSTKADGTAASAVKEPINTSTVPAKQPEPKLNWAALAEEDDDDLGEAPVFEPLPSSTTSALVTPEPGTPTAAEPETSAPTTAASAASAAAAASSAGGEAVSPKSKKSGKQGSGGAKGGNNGARGNGKGAPAKPASGAVKAQPKVDEDGFILQESKRTKYLQQKQQQQQRGSGGSGRGGKGGSGGGARGGRANGGSGNGRGGKGGEGGRTQTAATQ